MIQIETATESQALAAKRIKMILMAVDLIEAGAVEESADRIRAVLAKKNWPAGVIIEFAPAARLKARAIRARCLAT